MKLVLLSFVVLFLSSDTNIFAHNRVTKIDRKEASKMNTVEQTSALSNQKFYDGSITLEGPVQVSNNDFSWMIGPEIMTNISGYYDWQTNGACPRYIYYSSPTEIHAIMMIALDSLDNNTSRRTAYAFSSDGGSTWNLLAPQVPILRSGFPTLTVANNLAVIGNHYNNQQNILTAGISVDAFTGLGSFTSTSWTPSQTNFIWPMVETLTNGNILVGAQTYQSGMATDSCLVARFNPVTNTFLGHNFLFSPSTNNVSMRWAVATGPNGKAIYVHNPISDGDPILGNNRIFYFTTDDNGATWSGPNLLWQGGVQPNGDTTSAWVGIDAVYDNDGNFYVTWNSVMGLYSTAKLFASKNGGPAQLVTNHSMITGIAHSLATSMGNVCTIDWPSISVSENGQYVFVAFTAAMQDDTLNGFNAEKLYISAARTSDMNFISYTGNPFRVSEPGTDDIRYVSLNRTAFLSSGVLKLPFVYMKDPQPGSCAFNDNAPVSRSHLIYRETDILVGIDNHNNSTIPQEFALNQNHPNPFNPSTVISFNLPVNANVTLKVFDSMGREVANLLNNVLAKAGINEINFDARNLPSGIYFYSIQAGDFRDTKKMMLIK